MTRHIIALGGGSFSQQIGISPIDRYILSLSGKQYPKIAFLPTAAGDSTTYVHKFYDSFSRADCLMSHYSIFGNNHLDIRSYLLEQDIIYVGGGNTFNMLTLWKARGVDTILRECWERGIIMCGISAGSLCWFRAGNTDSFGTMDKIECMSWLPFSNSPHYDTELTRRPNFYELIRTNQIPAGYGVDEGVALHFQDQNLFKVIAEKTEARAYWIEVKNGQVVEDTIVPEFLPQV